MVTVEKANKYDSCNACSSNSGHNQKNVKRIECKHIAIYLCEVCREDMVKQFEEKE